MNIYARNVIISKNNDNTYKLEISVEFTDNKEGILIFPRVTTDLIDKNGNIDRSKLLYSFEPEGNIIFTIEIPEENEQ